MGWMLKSHVQMYTPSGADAEITRKKAYILWGGCWDHTYGAHAQITIRLNTFYGADAEITRKKEYMLSGGC